MELERIKQLLIESADKADKARTFREYEKWRAIYKALKIKWNKLTKNQLIIIWEV